MPVRFAAHQMGMPAVGPMAVARLSGTVWQGRVQLDGGHSITWNSPIFSSMLALAWVADWRLTGPGTDVAGRLVLRRGGVGVRQLSGVASWPLVAAFLPGMPIECEGQATFEALSVAIDTVGRSGTGSVMAPAGRCIRRDGLGGPVPTPALRAEVSSGEDGLQVVVTEQGAPEVPLVRALVTPENRLVLTIHKAGAAMVPGMPNKADSELDLPLAVVLGG